MAVGPQSSVNVSVNFQDDKNSLAREINRGLKSFNAQGMRGLDTAFGNITKNVRTFDTALDRANQRVILFAASASILYGVIRGFGELAKATVEVEKSLISINSVFRLTNQQLDQFSKGLFNVAVSTSQSFNKVAEAAQEFSRQGLTAGETIKRTKDAMILTRLAAIDTAEAVTVLTATINGFAKEALNSTQITNKLATVDAAFAVSTKDLVGALTRVGSAASDAGLSFDELIGLVTAAKQITGRDGPVIAQALNTIFTRLNRKDTIEALDGLGVSVRDLATGAILPTMQLLKNFASSYEQMTGTIKTSAAEQVGGVRNLNTLKALLGDLAKANNVVTQAQKVSASATNQAYLRNEELNTSLDATIQRMGIVSKQVFSNIGNVGFGGITKTVFGRTMDNPIIEMLREATGHAETTGGKFAESFLKGFGGAVVFGLGPIIVKGLYNVFQRTTSNIIADFKLAGGLTKETQQQALIQNQIVALYGQGSQELARQLALTTSIAERALIIRSALATQASMGVAAQRQLSAEAAAVYRGGYRVVLPKSAAGGYLPNAMGAETAAIGAGVGGAPIGARPVVLPSFNFGSGRRGPLVANSSEFLIPHMAGGSAIYNRDMIRKYGLPPGATPVAAGGWVPNAANAYNVPPSYRSGPMNPGYAFGVPPGTPYSYPEGVPEGGGAPAMGQGFGQYTGPAYGPGNSPVELAAKEKVLLEKQKQNAEFEARVLAQRKAAAEGEIKAFAVEKARVEAINYNNTKIFRGGVNKLGQPYPINAPAEMIGIQGPETDRAAAVRIELVKAANALSIVGAAKKRTSYAGMSDAEVAAKVYRQQMVEEKQASRQEEIIAQNKRIESLRVRLQADAARKLANTPPLEMQGPPLPPGWNPDGTRPGFFSRVSSRIGNRLSSPMGQFGVGLGLSFAGGMINEGKGGTAEGMVRGAASSGLQLAGAGMQIAGPWGALAGGVIGTTYGFLSKISKSFTELAGEIEESKKKLSQELESAVEVFRIQEKIKEAFNEGDRDAVAELQRQRTIQMSRVSPRYQKLVSDNLYDPNGMRNVLTEVNANNANASAGFGILSALKTSDTFSGMFGGALSRKNQRGSAMEAFGPALAGLSRSELEDLQQLNKRSPHEALSRIGARVGLENNPDFQGFINTVGTGVGNITHASVRDTAQYGISSAINRLLSQQDKQSKQKDEEMEGLRKSLVDLSTQLRTQANFISITGAANQQINQIKQQIALANPGLIDISRLQLSGTLGSQNIASQFGMQRKSDMFSGKADLMSIMSKLGVSQSSVDAVSGISSLSGLKNMRDRLMTLEGRGQLQKLGGENSPFFKALEDLIRKLEVLNFTEQENTRANDEGNRLMMEQLRFTKTRAGAGLEYRGAALNAGMSLVTSLNRNDPPDIILQKLLESRTADLNRRYQQGATSGGVMSLDEIYGEINQGTSPLRKGRGYASDTFPINAKGAKSAMSARQYYAERLNISTNAEAVQRINDAQAIRSAIASGKTQDLTGARIESGLLGGAQQIGMEGKSLQSFTEGFHARFVGLKQDIKQFAEVGATVANSLEQNLGNAFGNFVTGAQKGKEAFRSFVLGVLGDSARAFASKAVQGLLGMIFGALVGGTTGSTGAVGQGLFLAPGQSATGGFIGMAGGGRIPTMLTGGEYAFGPAAASRLGPSMLTGLNNGTVRKMAAGGALVRGGSGVMDDVPAMLNPGTFIVKKAMVERYGVPFLSALANGGSSSAFPVRMAGGGTVTSVATNVAGWGGGSSGGNTFNIGVTVNDNSSTSSSSQTSAGGGNSLADRNFAESLALRMKQVAVQAIEEQTRMGGMLRRQSLRGT